MNSSPAPASSERTPLRLCWRTARWALLRPLTTGAGTRERRVLEIRLEQEDRLGLGEAAPLPGLHHENLEDVLAVLQELARCWRERRPGEGPLELAQRAELGLPPSLAWALAWAWREWRSAGAPALPPPASAGLLDSPPQCWRDELLARPPRSCWKLKVGRHPIRREVAAFRELWRLHPGLEWRLDANRAWSLAEAQEFQQACGTAVPRWLEEPLRRSTDLLEWRRQGGWPYALDEGLQESLPAELLAGAAAWVLKPQRLGLARVDEHFAAARELARGQESAPCCVISACFESPPGLRALEELAAQAPGLPAPGLGTRDWLGARLDERAWEEAPA